MSSTPFQHPDADTNQKDSYFYKLFNVGGDTLSSFVPKQLQKHEQSSPPSQKTDERDIGLDFINVLQWQSLHDK
jgi:hypothetical protein